MKGDGSPSGGWKMRELFVVLPPSQLHCCMSEAKMAAPLSLAVFVMKLMVTFFDEGEGIEEGRRGRKREDDLHQ